MERDSLQPGSKIRTWPHGASGPLIVVSLALVLGQALGCTSGNGEHDDRSQPSTRVSTAERGRLAAEVRRETLRTWRDYKKYAWGYDVLRPLTKKGSNWYEESLGISPFDAYSTLKVMGFDAEAREIEAYALGMDWDKDVFVQVFEVNIRILGGLLSMYSHDGNDAILAKAIDFADRLLPAFATETGIPTHSVNLRTGERGGPRGKGTGEVVNVAQAASYLFEFGIASYYSKDPRYYQAAKKATMAVFERRSKLGLVGESINVRTGTWTSTWSHNQACIDSYYEYMFKSWLLFGDPEIGRIWKESQATIESRLGEAYGDDYYYTIVDMNTGKIVKRSVSLYDAYYPAIQALSGQVAQSERNQRTWHRLWRKHGLLPTRYSYDSREVEYANHELNPEIVESAYYLHQITGKDEYLAMLQDYWASLEKHCRSEVGYHSIEDVRTMKAKDAMPTFFVAETLKYLYAAFGGKQVFDFEAYAFSTEAHTFRRAEFDPAEARSRLGIQSKSGAR